MIRKLSIFILAAMFVVAVASGFTGCGTLSKIDAGVTPQNIATACATIAAGEDAVLLAAKAGKLSAAQLTAVRAAIPYKQAVCNAKPMPTSVTAAVYQTLLNAASATTAATAASPPPTQ